MVTKAANQPKYPDAPFAVIDSTVPSSPPQSRRQCRSTQYLPHRRRDNAFPPYSFRAPICNERLVLQKRTSKIKAALTSGADAPANLPTRARWTPPSRGDAAGPATKRASHSRASAPRIELLEAEECPLPNARSISAKHLTRATLFRATRAGAFHRPSSPCNPGVGYVGRISTATP